MFVDIFREGKLFFYDKVLGDVWVPVLSDVPPNNYKESNFSLDAQNRVIYRNNNGQSVSYAGIDISSHQKNIDWEKVVSDGIEFVIIRVGYRGYGEEGNIIPDTAFYDNVNGALSVGIEVGVYFFSQALNATEAIEEAEFVIDAVKELDITYPVVFDWENIPAEEYEDARTNDTSSADATYAAIAFCDTVQAAGYKPMIYTNKKQALLKYDLRLLIRYPVWLAYHTYPLNYYYDFEIWQYGVGKVDGIDGDVDLNVKIIKD